MGVATGDFNNDGCVDLFVTGLGRESAVQEQLQRNVHRRHERRATSTSRPGACRRRFSTTTATGSSTVRRPTTSTTASPTNTAMFQPVGQPRLLPAARLSRVAEPPLSQQPRRHVHRRHREGRHVARIRPGARRGRPPTSTATAGPISTSRTTASRISCGSTSTTGRSRTRRCSPASR